MDREVLIHYLEKRIEKLQDDHDHCMRARNYELGHFIRGQLLAMQNIKTYVIHVLPHAKEEMNSSS